MHAARSQIETTLTIVIVNYRTAGLLLECLRSLEPEVGTMSGAKVVVVDNASPDDSFDRLREAVAANNWNGWVDLIASPQNGGFAAGNNLGIRSRRSEFYLLLNPDTLIRPGAVAALISFMNEHPCAGIAGSMIEEPDARLHGSARRCPSPLGELEAEARTGPLTRLLNHWAVRVELEDCDAAMRCDWVSGAAMCVRRAVFDEIGLLDEGYFLYFEEVDLCERARRAPSRWEVWLVPRSRIMHVEGAAVNQDVRGRERPPCWYDSRRRFFIKRHGVIGLICADVLWAMGRSLFAVRRLLRLAGRSLRESRVGTTELLWGDVRAIATGEAFRIARGDRIQSIQ